MDAKTDSTKQRSQRFQNWVAEAPEHEVGLVLKSFFEEAEHGSWDSVPFRDLRAIRRLQADITSYNEALEHFAWIAEPCPPPHAEAHLAALVGSFDLDPDQVEVIKSSIMCILNCNGVPK